MRSKHRSQPGSSLDGITVLVWLGDKGATVLAERGESLFEPPKGTKKLSANVHGFNIEAGVVLEQHNRAALERPCRYLLRV